ncbi:MAG: YbaB/EbfC family nucleoid-associated protein [Bacilli bacterium]|nr:YbaB/EbfC family nucleoid-associated protein [Bacilli bacterium]MDD4795140.1 YbaB/EbfC family nucleoid-associated protein [Bacilli bacterium]
MNMQNLMAQAQKMKKDIEKKQEEINNQEFTTQNELVSITMLGSREIKKIKINEEKITDFDDLEALEDMIAIALKDILKQIDDETNSKMGMYGSGLNGLI